MSRFNLVETSCPPAGSGVHSWILATANRCRNAGLTEVQAEQFILGCISRQPNPASEIRSAISKSYNSSRSSPWSAHYVKQQKIPRPISDIHFDESKLKATASRIVSPANWHDWLWERSPERPETQNAFSCLAHLYAPGEKIHIFDNLASSVPLYTLTIGSPTDCRVPDLIRQGGRFGDGIWFLCNPVDGHRHPNPRQNNKSSCRSEESITKFRYAVLESDQASAEDWLSLLAQLPLRISAIYTSGARSIHCLIRLDAQSKLEWDAIISPLKRPLKVLGADPACLSAVRLSRLPACLRPNKNGLQKLLYLCPNPPLAPLFELPVLLAGPETLTDTWASGPNGILRKQ